MPTRNVNLTEHQDRFVEHAIARGQYQNASEVLRDGLRLLERRDIEDAAKLSRLRVAVAEGEAALASGDFEDIAMDDVESWLSKL